MENQVAEQLDLIEGMILEGRKTMERSGWVFVMWGVAHVTATVLTFFWPDYYGMLWGGLMGTCGFIMGIVGRRNEAKRRKSSVMGRAQGAAWGAFLISLFILWVAGPVSGSLTYPSPAGFLAVFFVLIGGANFQSGVTINLPMQTRVGLLWWIAGVLILFMPSATTTVFLVMALIAEIGFGLYLMSLERKGEAARV